MHLTGHFNLICEKGKASKKVVKKLKKPIRAKLFLGAIVQKGLKGFQGIRTCG